MSQNKNEEDQKLPDAKEKFEKLIKAYKTKIEEFFENQNILLDVKSNLGMPLVRLLEEANDILKKNQFRLDGLEKMSEDLQLATGIIDKIANSLSRAEALKQLQAIKLDPNPKTPFEKALTVFKYAVGITLVLGVVGAALFFSGGLAAIPLIGFLGAGGPAMFAAGFGAAAGYATFAASTMAAGFMSVAAPSAFTIGIMGASVNALYLGVAAVVTGAVGYLYREKIFGKSQEVKNVEKTDEEEAKNPLHTSESNSNSSDANTEKNNIEEINPEITHSDFDSPVQPTTQPPKEPPPPPPPRPSPLTGPMMHEKSLKEFNKAIEAKKAIEAQRPVSPTTSDNKNASLEDISPDSNNGPKNG